MCTSRTCDREKGRTRSLCSCRSLAPRCEHERSRRGGKTERPQIAWRSRQLPLYKENEALEPSLPGHRDGHMTSAVSKQVQRSRYRTTFPHELEALVRAATNPTRMRSCRAPLWSNRVRVPGWQSTLQVLFSKGGRHTNSCGIAEEVRGRRGMGVTSMWRVPLLISASKQIRRKGRHGRHRNYRVTGVDTVALEVRIQFAYGECRARSSHSREGVAIALSCHQGSMEASGKWSASARRRYRGEG